MYYTKIEQAKKYIDEHYAEIKSIRQAADYADMHYEYFLRSFRSAVGTGYDSGTESTRIYFNDRI